MLTQLLFDWSLAFLSFFFLFRSPFLPSFSSLLFSSLLFQPARPTSRVHSAKLTFEGSRSLPRESYICALVPFICLFLPFRVRQRQTNCNANRQVLEARVEGRTVAKNQDHNLGHSAFLDHDSCSSLCSSHSLRSLLLLLLPYIILLHVFVAEFSELFPVSCRRR